MEGRGRRGVRSSFGLVRSPVFDPSFLRAPLPDRLQGQTFSSHNCGLLQSNAVVCLAGVDQISWRNSLYNVAAHMAPTGLDMVQTF